MTCVSKIWGGSQVNNLSDYRNHYESGLNPIPEKFADSSLRIIPGIPGVFILHPRVFVPAQTARSTNVSANKICRSQQTINQQTNR